MPMPARSTPMTRQNEQGAVLIIVLIMLGLLASMAATNLHNAQSSEQISGNTRSTELAHQAAEMVLRHCEAAVAKRLAVAGGDTSSATAQYPTTFTDAHIHAIASPPDWQDAVKRWDVPSTHVFVLPLSLLGTASPYKRAPECMVESINLLATNPAPTGEETSNLIITARGFGPEVALEGAQRLRPVGSEVWLQTHLSLRPTSQAIKSRAWRQIFLR